MTSDYKWKNVVNLLTKEDRDGGMFDHDEPQATSKVSTNHYIVNHFY